MRKLQPHLTIAIYQIFGLFLKIMGLWQKGYRNYLDIQISRCVWKNNKLPENMAGISILQLSDLHLDLDTRITASIIRKLQHISADICVITGDFCDLSSGSTELMLTRLKELRPYLPKKTFGVLGNHDPIEIIPYIEALQIHILHNSLVSIDTLGGNINLVGIEDCTKAISEESIMLLQSLPDDKYNVLLSHNPKIYTICPPQVSLVLSGHTHGGQICLPNQRPIKTALPHKYAREVVVGCWNINGIIGFTSRGVGACTIPIRFFCNPEIVMHQFFPSGTIV